MRATSTIKVVTADSPRCSGTVRSTYARVRVRGCDPLHTLLCDLAHWVFWEKRGGRRRPGPCGCMRGGVVRRTMKVRGVTAVRWRARRVVFGKSGAGGDIQGPVAVYRAG